MRTARWLAALAGALAVCAIPSAASAQSPPPDSQFQKVVIDQTPGEPIDLAVLPDGRVLHTERSGEVWLHDPETGLKTLAAKLDVYRTTRRACRASPSTRTSRRTGGSTSTTRRRSTRRWTIRRPDRERGRRAEFGTAEDFAPFKGYIQLSRFQWTGDSIDLDTEQQILQVPVDRGICCHVGGDIVFDGNGNLLLSTGDDTNPFESEGFTPIDERADRNPAFDAQRTSANTNDLRGKVLRISRPRAAATRSPRATSSRTTTHPARDLRDGPAQPVPHRVQPRDGGALHRRLLTGRETRRTRCAGLPATASGRS